MFEFPLARLTMFAPKLLASRAELLPLDGFKSFRLSIKVFGNFSKSLQGPESTLQAKDRKP